MKLVPLFGQPEEMLEGKRTLGFGIGSALDEMHEGKRTLGCAMPLLGLTHLQRCPSLGRQMKCSGEEDPKLLRLRGLDPLFDFEEMHEGVVPRLCDALAGLGTPVLLGG